jgi:hypothetical protein
MLIIKWSIFLVFKFTNTPSSQIWGKKYWGVVALHFVNDHGIFHLNINVVYFIWFLCQVVSQHLELYKTNVCVHNWLMLENCKFNQYSWLFSFFWKSDKVGWLGETHLHFIHNQQQASLCYWKMITFMGLDWVVCFNLSLFPSKQIPMHP